LEEEEQALINEIELRLKAIEDAVSHARGSDEKMFASQAQQQLNQVTHQSTECRQKLATLQQEYLKMEDMVKNLLDFKARIEHLKQEKSTLTVAYEVRFLSALK